jgi:hypothetical protein
MAELTFRSPGVSTREIDLSAPSAVTPSGTPAAVIGTSLRGPAFVPVTVADFASFANVFGGTDGVKFGPLAMREWLRNAGSGVYMKVLGAGDGQRRLVNGVNAGKVTNSGFVVGAQLPQASSGFLGRNPYATNGGTLGRTHFLGCYMSDSAGSTYFTSAGVQPSPSAVPVVRGVVLAPSGVFLTLQSGSTSETPANVQAGSATGESLGAVDTTAAGRDQFKLLLNGHINTAENPNIITASFDPTAPNYFATLLNTDPLKIEEAGHLLYASWDIYPAVAEVTGTGLAAASSAAGGYAQTQEPIAFVLTGSQTHNSGSTVVPNYEGYEDRYRAAFSPWFISQAFGGRAKNLFRIHALDDGAFPTARLKLSVENISTSRDAKSPYGTFDLLVRRFSDTDLDPVVLERFSRLSLDPDSDRYVARVIGDRHTYFDWDKRLTAQRLVTEGNYANQSALIRVEMDSEVDDKTIDATALPVGFRGPYHLVTSGSGLLADAGIGITTGSPITGTVQPPVPLRDTVAFGTGLKKRASNALYWGMQFEVKDSAAEPNRSLAHDTSVASFTTYFPNYHTNYANPWVGASDAADDFCNNLFTLERVAVVTGTDGVADATKWLSASYSRNGASPSVPRRLLNVATDLGSLANRPFVKFSTLVQGGFDGVNIFDENKAQLLDLAVRREMDDPTGQGGTSGPTVAAYRKALTILGAQANADIQLLAIPGIRHEAVTDFAIQEVEDRFDALYLMDVEQRDTTNSVITGSANSEVSVTYTAAGFTSRNLDSSFGAAYFPDVVMSDPTTRTNLVVPPTVAVLGAFALNDAVGFPWFAPAGFTRGALPTSLEASVKLNRANLDTLQDADINPIVAFPGQAPVVFGQKTLQQAQTALDRINVRRLLIDVRRKVKAVANSFIFEPNRAETLAVFQSQVQPILQAVQAQRGVERFRVIIDTSTTTQADVENNTVRGKIFLQPTRSLEFVSLDFAVTNSGAVV